MRDWMNKHYAIVEYTLFLLFGIVFYILLGNKWVSIEDDSEFYMHPTGREGVMPVYPAFLRVMRVVLGEEHYLDGAVIVQSVLAIFCTAVFVLVLKRHFVLKLWEELLLYVACMLPFSIYLPESGITHQIMTEALAYPLFYIYFSILMIFVFGKQYKWGTALVVMSLFMMLIRSQLMILLITTFAAFIYVIIRRIPDRRKAARVTGWCFGLAIVGGGLFIAGLRSQVIDISQFTNVLMIRGFYEADYEDKELFGTPEMQEIYERVYRAVDEKRYRYVYARQDLYMWKDIVCDRIPFIAHLEILGYKEEHPGLDMNERKILQTLGSTILFKHFGRYLYHTVRLMVSGFIAAVFFQVDSVYLLCHFITLFLYIYALLGSILCLKYKGDKKVSEFMLTVVGFILILIVTVDLVFFGMQRYVVYAMGIFYCAAYLLFRELVMLCVMKMGSVQKNARQIYNE